jgi:hypothetical protein
VKRGTLVRGLVGICAVLAVAAIATGLGLTAGKLSAGPSPRSAHPAKSALSHHAQGLPEASPTKASFAAELVELSKSRSSVSELVNAPGMPACAHPSIPAATSPPGNSYGVPFLAAITSGQILTGYDEWSANHYHWQVGSKTDELYPWVTKIYNISGWVTGLIQLPSLNATITPNQIVFCDQGGNACESASPPAGECVAIRLGAAPISAGQAPPPAITNVPFPGKTCSNSYSSTAACVPFNVVLTPSGDTKLTVTGVEPDGALEIAVTTSAVTTVKILDSSPVPICQNAPTTLTLSTQSPSGLPSGAPIAPRPGNPDLRPLQTAPAPLTGPLAKSSSTVASDDITVPAFPATTACTFSQTLDAPLGGWNNLPSQDADAVNNNYYDKTPLPANAGLPGWVQFSAITTVVTLGFPIGPPPNFNF